MTSLPSYRPRGAIGDVRDEKVYMTRPFMVWLDLLVELARSTSAVPVGTIRTSFDATEATGWKRLNGQALSKTTFAALYAIIGDGFGSTDTTFNLPDVEDRVMVGAGAISLAETGGASSVTLSSDNLPAHTHTITDPGHTHGITDPGHSHTVTDPGHSHSTTAAANADVATGADETVALHDAAATTGSATTGVSIGSAQTGVTAGSATTGLTVESTGGGQSFAITPLAIGVAVFIKT